MMEVILKRFEAPDEVRRMPKGRFEIIEVFGEPGRHTRMAVGVSALPYDVAVEVEAVFEVS